jgi:prophage antirepressor-like protein
MNTPDTTRSARVVTDEPGRRWVQAADVPEIRKLPHRLLIPLCPEVAHFETSGRPVRWLPVDKLAALLVARGVPLVEAEARATSYATAVPVASGLRRQGLPSAGPVGEVAAPAPQAASPVAPTPAPVEEVTQPVAVAAELVGPTPLAEARAAVEDMPVAPAGLLPPAPAPLPIATNGPGATIELGGKSIAIHTHRARGCVIAADLGALLKYGNEGKGLADVIRKHWGDEVVEGRDFDVLSGDALRDFKARAALTGEKSVSRNARDLMVLYERGVDMVVQKTEKPLGATLRAYLADEVLPRLRRGEPVALHAPHAAPGTPVLDEERLINLITRTVTASIVSAMPAMIEGVIRVVQSLPALLQPPRQEPVAAAPEAAPPAPVAVAPAPPAAPVVPLPQPTMLIPRDWRSADVLAALLGERRCERVSRRKVNGAIGDLRLRERPEVARHGMVPRTAGGGVAYEVPFWRYAPSVLDELERHLFPSPASQQHLPVSR